MNNCQIGASSGLMISIIMPALNEEKNISSAVSSALKSFERFGIRGEIVVINDGSTDKTEEIVRGIAENDSRVRMIKHALPMGIGRSFWDGVDNAAGGAVVMMPGDDENDPDEILRYAKLLEDVDIIIPFIFNRDTSRSMLRNAVSSLYRFIINATFLTSFNYTNGTSVYKKEILKIRGRRCSGFFFQTDILVRLARRGYLFAQVPCRLKYRPCGASKAISLRSLIGVAKEYIRLLIDIYLRKTEKRGDLHPGSASLARYGTAQKRLT